MSGSSSYLSSKLVTLAAPLAILVNSFGMLNSLENIPISFIFIYYITRVYINIVKNFMNHFFLIHKFIEIPF